MFSKIRGQWQHWSLLVVIILTLLAYSNTWSVPFQFDDTSHLEWAQRVATVPLQQWYGEFLQYPYRQVPMLSFVLQYVVWSNPPIGFLHAGNLFFHILNTVLVYALTYVILQLFTKPSLSRKYTILISAGVAGIFALHPVQTQAVTYIIQRMSSLAATFYIGSVLCFLLAVQFSKRSTKIRQGLLLMTSVILGILGYFSKQNTVVLPMMIILILWLSRSMIATKSRILFGVASGVLILTSAWLVLSYQFAVGPSPAPLSAAAMTKEQLTLESYGLTQASLVPRYLSLMLLPIRQSVDHSPAVFSTWETPVIVGIMIWLALACIALLSMKSHPVVTLGLAWYLIAMLIESSIIPISDPFVEHRLYLPIVGMALAVVYSLFLITRRYQMQQLLKWLLLVMCVLLTLATYRRNQAWQTPVSLWENASINSPSNPRAFYNLGVSLVTAGEREKALKAFLETVRIHPQHHYAHTNAGVIYYSVRDYESALFHFLRAIESRPNEELYQQNVEKAVTALDAEDPTAVAPDLVHQMFR